MKTHYQTAPDGSLSITVTFNPTGSLLEQEEQIAAAVAEVGRLATELRLESFDTDGAPIVINNIKHTSRGMEKKLIKRRGVK